MKNIWKCLQKCLPGPSCSKLTMSLVNDSLKFTKIYVEWYSNVLKFFCWKNVSSFCSAKATHIFSAKNIIILYIESAKTVKEMTLNELVKLTMQWTTGPRVLSVRLFYIQRVSYTIRIFFSGHGTFFLIFISWQSLDNLLDKVWWDNSKVISQHVSWIVVDVSYDNCVQQR